MRPFTLSLVLAATLTAACGSDDDGGGSSGKAVANGANLADLPAFAGACTGTVSADFATDGKGWDNVEASFTAGQRLVLAMTSKWGTDPGEWEIYRANAGVTGFNTLRVPGDKLTVDCAGARNAVVVLSKVVLYTDKAYSTVACTLEATAAPVAGALTGYGYVSSGKDYDGTVTITSLTGSTCPTDQELFYPIAAETNTYGSTTKVEAFRPMANVYVK
jgi:hypothetical protein